MIELANGRLIETDEEKPALRRTLDWWRGSTGWGWDLPPRKQSKGIAFYQDSPSVTPAPASEEPRYGEPIKRKCLREGCETLIGKHQQRCKPCAKIHHYAQKAETRRVARWNARNLPEPIATTSPEASA